MSVTPEHIRTKLFTTVRLRQGYEQAEVDEFLDEIEAELAGRLDGAAPRAVDSTAASMDEILTAKLAAPGQMFSRVMLREGYLPGEVDEFVAEIAVALAGARR